MFSFQNFFSIVLKITLKTLRRKSFKKEIQKKSGKIALQLCWVIPYDTRKKYFVFICYDCLKRCGNRNVFQKVNKQIFLLFFQTVKTNTKVGESSHSCKHNTKQFSFYNILQISFVRRKGTRRDMSHRDIEITKWRDAKLKYVQDREDF